MKHHPHSEQQTQSCSSPFTGLEHPAAASYEAMRLVKDALVYFAYLYVLKKTFPHLKILLFNFPEILEILRRKPQI